MWQFLREIFSILVFNFQIFTNADKAHAARVLNRLGVEECFEGIICFETLNPPIQPVDFIAASPEAHPTSLPADTSSHTSNSKILCKPSLEAIEATIRIARVDPKKTVRLNLYSRVSVFFSYLE